MSLTECQLFAVSVAERVSSTVSLTSASIAVLTFLSKKAFRTPINRLIFYALCGNIVLNIATLISLSGPQHGQGSSLCTFQAFLIQWFFPADALWALCIAWNVYMRFLHRYNTEQLRRLEWIYLLLCYGLPFIPALTLLFIQAPSRGGIYGPAVFHCWIANPWDAMRIVVMYGPVWLFIIVTVAIYVRVGRYIYLHLRQLRELGVTRNWVEDVNRLATVSTTELYEIDPLPSNLHQDHSLEDESGVCRQSTASELSINRDSGGIDRASSDPNITAWAYTRYSLLFFIALLVTWVPSTANRLSTVINRQYVSFGLNYAAAFVIPLQGFWNSLIYMTISRLQFKALFRRSLTAF